MASLHYELAVDTATLVAISSTMALQYYFSDQNRFVPSTFQLRKEFLYLLAWFESHLL